MRGGLLCMRSRLRTFLVDQHYPVAIRYCLRANGIPYRAGKGNYAL